MSRLRARFVTVRGRHIETLKFFADHCVSNFIVQTLREAGYEVLRLRDHIPTDSADEVVISEAQAVGAILISLDGDFSDIVAYPPSNYRGIINLQIRDHPEVTPQIVERLLAFLTAHAEPDYYRWKLFVVEVHRIRIRD